MPVGGPEAGHREERAGRGGDACVDAPGTMPERETPPGAEAEDAPPRQAPPPGRAEGPAGALLRVEDTTGRRLGSGFLADDRGTVVTAYEAVRDAAELLVGRADGAGGAGPVRIGADAVTPLPGSGLALLRAPGLAAVPLPVAAGEAARGAYVLVAAGGWRQARVLGPAPFAGDGADGALAAGLELAIGTDGRNAARPGGGAAGAPVLDAATGQVLAVLTPALEVGRQGCFAVPLRAAVRDAPDGALAALLARNEATVPALGAGLNLAGALQLTATTVGSEGPQSPTAPPVERPGTAAELAAFEDGPCLVLGLVGAPGTGRTTELAALAARRAAGANPAPTVWLRGADLLPDDLDVGDAARRALARAARIVEAAGGTAPDRAAPHEDASPEEVARLARRAGRSLVLLLDGPEEMPPALAHRLSAWTTGTATWLARTGAKLVVGCRPEYWEQVCGLFPGALRHRPAEPQPGRPVTDCVPLGDLPEAAAAKARARYGLADGLLAERHARHPLTLRLLADVRRALPPGVPDPSERQGPGEDGSALPLDRDAVFSAYLDLMCLRTAVRLAAPHGLRGTALRRVAARVAGQLHEAARRCLGPGQGELDRESFESLFPWGTGGGRLGELPGCASAVLTEGLIIPAGAGYRFAHEELGDWLQGAHLDVDAALSALVHRWRVGGAEEAGGGGGAGCGAAGAGVEAGGGARETARDAETGGGERGCRGGAPVVGVECGSTEVGSGLGPGDGAEEMALPRATVRRRRRMAERAAAEAGRSGSAGTGRGVEGASPDGASELRDGAVVRGGDGAEEPAGGAGYGGADTADAGPAPAESGLNVGHGAGRAAPYGAADQRNPAARAAPHGGRGAVPGAVPTVPRTLPVPRHRIGPVVEALLHLARNRGADELSRRLAGLIEAADEFLTAGEASAEPEAWVPRQLGSPDRERATRVIDGVVGGGEAGAGGLADGPVPPSGRPAADGAESPGPRGGRSGTSASRPTAEPVTEPSAPSAAGSSAPHSTPPRTGRATWENAARPRARAAAPRRTDGAGPARDPRPALAPWWAVRLLGETLLRLPDCTPYLGVLRVLAGWIVERARERGVPQDFGPWFWAALALPAEERADLLRRLVVADGTGGDDRFLAAAGEFLGADARTAQPLLCAWFGDDRRLPALPAATVATAAQALLYTHREGHADTLVDALVADGHERADELLSTLAEEDPGAVCRGVARWAVDPRPARRVAAVAYGLRAAPYAASEADRELLRVAAATLLSRTADAALHGGALALLVRDPVSRGRYVEQAAARFAAAQDPQLTAAALGVALASHPGPVLDAFRRRLAAPGSQAGDVLRVLAEEAAPAVAAPATEFAAALLRARPDTAGHVAAYAERRLARGGADAEVGALVRAAFRTGPPSVRAALAPLVAAPCDAQGAALRGELLTELLREETHPDVLEALLVALVVRHDTRPGAAPEERDGHAARLRSVVLRVGTVLARGPEGGRRLDRRLAELARTVPGFAAYALAWYDEDPGVWRALVGSRGLRTIEDVAASGGRTAPAGTPGAERVPSAWHS
ncbi:Large Pro/Ala/Gly-rich protein [Streptomyces albidoflavus]|uniref:trypsin-like peptidase domain-containing protein n=1 Tax=Streptomyces albidoflavus TaxID=1886 RepID=UPI00078D37AA|nr:trypsin-like peptidase domain-containing protein [Streptomyces albidoflavus]AMM07929.1 Large Pro/Ala/Gly-rich protein [Streptomyces albidoflavus]